MFNVHVWIIFRVKDVMRSFTRTVLDIFSNIRSWLIMLRESLAILIKRLPILAAAVNSQRGSKKGGHWNSVSLAALVGTYIQKCRPYRKREQNIQQNKRETSEQIKRNISTLSSQQPCDQNSDFSICILLWVMSRRVTHRLVINRARILVSSRPKRGMLNC